MSGTNSINLVFTPVTSDDPLDALHVASGPATGIAQAALFGPTRALTKARGFFDRVTTTISSIFGPPPTFSSAVQGCFKLDNINSTANAFLDNPQLTEQIDQNFQDQLGELQGWVNDLKVNFTEYCFSKYEVVFKFIL